MHIPPAISITWPGAVTGLTMSPPPRPQRSFGSFFEGFGGPGRVRTVDLFHAMEARSQLRHRPKHQRGNTTLTLSEHVATLNRRGIARARCRPLVPVGIDGPGGAGLVELSDLLRRETPAGGAEIVE